MRPYTQTPSPVPGQEATNFMTVICEFLGQQEKRWLEFTSTSSKKNLSLGKSSWSSGPHSPTTANCLSYLAQWGIYLLFTLWQDPSQTWSVFTRAMFQFSILFIFSLPNSSNKIGLQSSFLEKRAFPSQSWDGFLHQLPKQVGGRRNQTRLISNSFDTTQLIEDLKMGFLSQNAIE